MDKKDIKLNINPEYLEFFRQEMDKAQKAYSSIFGNYHFQELINNTKRIQEIVNNATKAYEPIMNSLAKQQEFVEMIKNFNSYDISNFQPIPKSILLKQHKKEYSEEEVEDIIEKVIKQTLKSIETEENQIKIQNKFPQKLDPKTPWENIVIKFKDRHNVQIAVDDYIYVANYKEMGFEDSRKLKPNIQWILLEGLSKLRGEISWQDNKARLNVKKQKQLLASGLKNYFSINDDPFYPYKKEKAYRLRINIIPESESINDYQLEDKNYDADDDLGIKESFKEFTDM